MQLYKPRNKEYPNMMTRKNALIAGGALALGLGAYAAYRNRDKLAKAGKEVASAVGKTRLTVTLKTMAATIAKAATDRFEAVRSKMFLPANDRDPQTGLRQAPAADAIAA